jgi:hypothetical protein
VTTCELTPLSTRVEFMQFCDFCDSEQIFVAGWESERGLVGCCLGCGQEREKRFTRTVVSREPWPELAVVGWVPYPESSARRW